MLGRTRLRYSASSVRRAVLYESVLRSGTIMPSPCTNCSSASYECIVSLSESQCCAKCINLGRSDCDVLGLSRNQLLCIAYHHSSLEAQLELAEEEADRASDEVRRLRKEKLLWFRRMEQAIRRGLEMSKSLKLVRRKKIVLPKLLLPWCLLPLLLLNLKLSLLLPVSLIPCFLVHCRYRHPLVFGHSGRLLIFLLIDPPGLAVLETDRSSIEFAVDSSLFDLGFPAQGGVNDTE